MIDRDAVVGAVAAELDARAERCVEEHAAIGARVADRLGLVETHSELTGTRDPAEEINRPAELPRSSLFVRRTTWVPVEVAARFNAVIVCTRSGAGRVSLDRAWCSALRASGAEIVGWDWMLEPGKWREGLEAEIARLVVVGGRALCLNVEPASKPIKGTPRDWRGHHAELAEYTATAAELCHAAELELWVTSWAVAHTSPTFPWRELLQSADVAIPQPYEVHGAKGPEYVAESIRQYTELGARRLILGRGAHELDKSDADYWRTPAQVREHRSSTPTGMPEAWWVPGGRLRPAVVDAMVAPLG